MKIHAILAVLSIYSATHVGALAEENEFIQSRAMALANAYTTRFGNDIDSEFQGHAGVPRHYVSAYQLMVTELFGFQFQCVSSSVWASKFDNHFNKDECRIYLRSGAMRFASGDEFFPYSIAAWRGTLLVRESSGYRLEYDKYFRHLHEAGSSVAHRMSFTLTDLMTGQRIQIKRTFAEVFDHASEPRDSYIPSGIYDIKITVESFFTRKMYSYGLENIEGGIFVRFYRLH